MKRVFVSLVFSLPFVFLAVAGMKTDLQEEGLIGQVRTVRVETAQFSSQSGHWVEGPRGPSVTMTYNVEGNKSEQITPESKTLYTYNAQGNLSVIVTYETDRSLCQFGYPCDTQGRRLETHLSYDAQGRNLETHLSYFDGTLDQKIVYTYDDTGRLIEETTSDRAGLILKRVYTYDGKGNLTAEEVYGPNGLKYRSEYTYDEGGRSIAATNSDAHDPGLGIDKTVETYDTNGNILEMTTYYTHKIGDEEDTLIPPPAKLVYTYEWDAHGNWVKQLQTACLSETGKPVCKPSMVTYRIITYSSETEVQQPQ